MLGLPGVQQLGRTLAPGTLSAGGPERGEAGVEGKWVRVVVGLGEECMKTVGRPFRFRVVNALHFKIRENLRS